MVDSPNPSGVGHRVRPIDPYYWIVAGAPVVVGLVLRIVGVPFNADLLGPPYRANLEQLLDFALLRHDLIRSILDLHTQPPLYNAAFGVLLHLPHGLQSPVAQTALLLCSVATAVATYGSMVLLGVPRTLALALVLVLVVADPAEFLFSMTLLYAAPTAALVTSLAFTGIRAALRPTVGNAALFAACGTVLCLFSTSLQPLVFLALLAVVVLALPSARRALIAGSIVPVAVLGLWTVHMTVSFGTPATSTWLGMNLAHSTTMAAPRSMVEHLVRRGVLTPLAEQGPFAPLGTYGVPPARTGGPALSQVTKSDGHPNLNNRAYIGVSQEFLHNDLRFITAEPGQYATQVARGVSVWFVPADQYFALPSTVGTRYRSVYDRWVQWQPTHDDLVAAQVVYGHRPAAWSQLSYLQLLATLTTLIGVPVLVASRWRTRRRTRWRWRSRAPSSSRHW